MLSWFGGFFFFSLLLTPFLFPAACSLQAAPPMMYGDEAPPARPPAGALSAVHLPSIGMLGFFLHLNTNSAFPAQAYQWLRHPSCTAMTARQPVGDTDTN